jgi:hypothetical protein
LIKSTDFKPEDVNVDLYKRAAAAIAQECITGHNMRESDLDDPDVVYLFGDTKDVRQKVEAQRKNLLRRDGQPHNRCKEKVY